MLIETRIRASLWFLVVSGAVVGIWALFFPQAFYDSFPGMGRSWVSVDGPFNEHLIRDVGGGYLSITVLALVAIIIKTRELALATALVWLVTHTKDIVLHDKLATRRRAGNQRPRPCRLVARELVPHFTYHMYHLDMYPAVIDKIGNIVSLVALVLVPAYILVQTMRKTSG